METHQELSTEHRHEGELCVSWALYSYSVNGIVMILTATHVDDIIWANEPEFETIVQEMQRAL